MDLEVIGPSKTGDLCLGGKLEQNFYFGQCFVERQGDGKQMLPMFGGIM